MYPPDTTAASLVPSAEEVMDFQARVASEVFCSHSGMKNATLDTLRFSNESATLTYKVDVPSDVGGFISIPHFVQSAVEVEVKLSYE